MEDLQFTHHPDTEPIPGYRLLTPLGRGGFGEVWKCEAPGGLHKAIKFVHGGLHVLDQNAPADEELRAIQRVKAIRHPFILTMERVEIVEGELVIVMELADSNLADRFKAEQKDGRTGIAREELLGYLREAAEVLDVMNARYGLQHLDIKPQNLFVVSDHAKVGDFGLVNQLLGPQPEKSRSSSSNHGPALGAITPLYAAPEVFQGSISSHSDQYSLAIVFQELLTGKLPFNGRNARQLLMQHIQCEPDLSSLPEADRSVVARAMSKDPHNRFPSCTDFIHALASGQTEVVTTTVEIAKAPRPNDTRPIPSVKTIRTRAVACRPPALPADSRLGGLEITDLINRSPLWELWRAQTAGGKPRIVKVIFGGGNMDQERIRQLMSLHHSSLVPTQVVECTPGRVVLAYEPGERSLREEMHRFQSQGLSGVPRAALLKYYRQLAEGLTILAESQKVFHLGLNPRSIVITGDRAMMSDFGLAQMIWLPSGQKPAALNPRYSAPELLLGQPGSASDQFSLALIYLEMSTGVFPPLLQANQKEPSRYSVGQLRESDRAIISRALDPNPQKRFPTVIDFVNALSNAAPDSESSIHSLDPSPAGASVAPDAGTQPGDVLRTRFGTTLDADTIRKRLEGFRKQWEARVVSADPQYFIFHMKTPSSFWQRFTGKLPRLEIHLEIADPNIAAPTGVQVRTDVIMELRPKDCTQEQTSELLKVVGPLLVESVRTHLQVNPRGRTQERLVWHHPLQLCSLLPNNTFGPPIECQGKDISLNGIGFYLPGQELPSSQVMLYLPQTPQTANVAVPARIVRIQGCGDGWYEVGAVLLPPDELPPEEEETAQ